MKTSLHHFSQHFVIVHFQCNYYLLLIDLSQSVPYIPQSTLLLFSFGKKDLYFFRIHHLFNSRHQVRHLVYIDSINPYGLGIISILMWKLRIKEVKPFPNFHRKNWRELEFESESIRINDPASLYGLESVRRIRNNTFKVPKTGLCTKLNFQ